MEDLSRSYSSGGSSSFNFCMSRSLSSLRLHGEENSGLASSPSSLHDETFSDARHPLAILEKLKVEGF